MPTVEYLENVQSFQKGDTAFLNQPAADEQVELGIVKIVAGDEPLTIEEERANTLRGVREAEAEKAAKSKSKK